jgi:hypothetical protein
MTLNGWLTDIRVCLGLLYRRHAQDGHGQDPAAYRRRDDAEAGGAGKVVEPCLVWLGLSASGKTRVDVVNHCRMDPDPWWPSRSENRLYSETNDNVKTVPNQITLSASAVHTPEGTLVYQVR